MTEDFNDDSPGEESPELAAAAAAAAEFQRRPRKPRNGVAPAPEGLGKEAPVGDEPNDALAIWDLILRTKLAGRDSGDVTIVVTRLMPPDPLTNRAVILGEIPGGAVEGGSSALMHALNANWHASFARAAVYDLFFKWRVGGQAIRHSKVSLGPYREPPSPYGFGAPYGGSSGYGFGQAPPQVPYGYQGPPPGFRQPPQASASPSQAQHPDPMVSYLSSQVAHLNGKFEMLLDAIQKGQTPAAAAAGVAAPPAASAQPAQPMTLDNVADLVVAKLKAAGLGSPTPTAPQAASMADVALALAADHQKMMRAMRTFRAIVAEGADIAGYDDDAPQTALAEPMPKGHGLPFEVIEVPGGPLFFGRPAQFAKTLDPNADTVTKLGHMALANPQVIEKGMEVAQHVFEKLSGAFQNPVMRVGTGEPPPTEVVSHIPRDAKDGGWPGA